MRTYPNPVKSFITACSLALLVVATSDASAAEAKAAAPAAAADPATQIRELTGAQTRIVWIRHKQWETGAGTHNKVDGGIGYSIMVFDTGGKGERELVPEGEIYNPLITPSGRQVIYSMRTDGKLRIHGVNWDGANSRVLSDGFAQWTWRDPATGIEWVYASNVVKGPGDGGFVDRFQLDKPEVKERIYTGSLANRFSLSADGTRAVAEFPWPRAGMLYTRTGQVDFRNYRTGCNSYLAPDDSYMVSIMSGSHDLITLYKPDGSSRDIGLMPPGLKPLKDGGTQRVVWNPKWASDARHMVVAGPLKNLSADRSDIWLGQFADDFNSIAKWVQVTDNDYMDVYAYVWVDPGLGQYTGEVPYTPAVPSTVTGPGNWQWTFGDGSKGTEAKHTYGKAGTYTITATQGERTLKGTVRVSERAAPKLLSAVAFDDRHVLLTCSEPVQVAAAKVTLASGTAATKLSLDGAGGLGCGILAEFAAPLAAKETLTVTGVTDCAQVPNEMTAKVQVVLPDWPSNRAGLMYLWKNENARVRNVIMDERTGLPVTTSLNGGARHIVVPVRFNRFGAALAEGDMWLELSPGAFVELIRDGMHKTKQFSFEIVVASADLTQTKGNDELNIAQWGWAVGGTGLFQEKDKLLAVLFTELNEAKREVFEMATLPDTKPHHVIISWDEKRLACYVDGKKVKEIDPSPATLLTHAGVRFAENGWRGTFEYLAFYNRFIEAPEAANNAAVVAAELAKRTTPPKIEVQARLVTKSKVPETGQMAPYRHALIVNEYEVEKVLKGAYAGKTIRVAQWGILDLKPTPLAAQAPGTSVKLVLEPFADHDELVPELISDTLKEDFDLKLYTDVNL